MAIIAVIAGAEHWNEIAIYCKSKEFEKRTKKLSKMLKQKICLFENGFVLAVKHIITEI